MNAQRGGSAVAPAVLFGLLCGSAQEWSVASLPSSVAEYRDRLKYRAKRASRRRGRPTDPCGPPGASASTVLSRRRSTATIVRGRPRPSRCRGWLLPARFGAPVGPPAPACRAELFFVTRRMMAFCCSLVPVRFSTSARPVLFLPRSAPLVLLGRRSIVSADDYSRCLLVFSPSFSPGRVSP